MKCNKIFLSVFFVAILALCLCILPARADAADVSDLTFELNADGKGYTVTRCDDAASGELTIPSTFNGYPVTVIGSNSFYSCIYLTTVTIPDSVTTIGEQAFYNCYGLTSLTIPGSVTAIEDYAFYNCDGLTDIVIPDGVTSIDDFAFYDCGGLTSVTIPDSVTTIGYCAFANCYRLAHVYIIDPSAWCKIRFAENSNPAYNAEYFHILDGEGNEVSSINLDSSVTTIPAYAFRGCRHLESVSIPDSVTVIGQSAFENCAKLNTLSLGNGITNVGAFAFSSCDSLTYNNYDSAKYLGNSKNPYLYLVSATSREITAVDIHKDTKIIGEEAFYQCLELTQMTIPGGVTTIGNSAFYNCYGLTSLTIPGSVTTIGEYAFQYCYGLGSVTIPGSVTTIGNSAFYLCSGLTSVIINNGVKVIDGSAFYKCTSLKTLWIPDSVTSISNLAFRYCDALEDIYYSGTEEQWQAIEIQFSNEPLLNCPNIHYNCAPKTGWVLEDGKWYFYNKGTKVPAGWFAYGPYWYYMDQNQAMRTGWLLYGGKWYFFDHTSGRMVTEKWIQDAGKWYYFDANGYMVTGIVTIGGKQHKFSGSGVWRGEVTANGWKQENGKWYYYQNGTKATGWKTIGGVTYYFDGSGVMKTGWQQISGKWYYFDGNGARKTGWLQLGNAKYYLKPDGSMATGVVTIDGKQHKFDANGVWQGEYVKTGWIQENGKWYYYHNGVKLTGKQVIGGKTYMFDSTGAMKTGWYSTQGNTNTHWYKKWFAENSYVEWFEFELIYLDGDDIPELWGGGSLADGNILVTCYNGKVSSYNFTGGGALKYAEKTGRFHISSGWQGYYGDELYTLINGKIVSAGSGSNEIDFETGVETYSWNGKRVSESTYHNYITSFLGNNVRLVFGSKSLTQIDNALLELYKNSSDNKVWYYFMPTGEMATGTTLTIGGKQYSFDDSGICLNP